ALSPEEGMRLLERALASREALSAPMALDLSRLRAGLERSGTPVPSLFRKLLLLRAQPKAQDSSLQTRLGALPETERRAAVLELVGSEVAQVLGLSASHVLAPARPLKELGLDSLMAVEIRNRLSNRLGARLPTTLLFDHPTPESLSRFLLENVL